MAGTGAKAVISVIGSILTQGVTLGMSVIGSGIGNVPKAPIEFPLLTDGIVNLVGKFNPGFASWNWNALVVNLVLGWLASLFIIIGVITVFKSLIAGILIAAFLIIIGMIFFGLHFTFPSLPSLPGTRQLRCQVTQPRRQL